MHVASKNSVEEDKYIESNRENIPRGNKEKGQSRFVVSIKCHLVREKNRSIEFPDFEHSEE